MGQPVEYIDLREVPNEFIIGAYNLVINKTMNKNNIGDTDHWNFKRFLTIINPNCLQYLEKKKQKVLNDYKNEYLRLIQEQNPQKLMSGKFAELVHQLQTTTRNKLNEIQEYSKIHKRFYHTLKGLMHEDLSDFENYTIIERDSNPNKPDEGQRVLIYKNYVHGFYKGYDFIDYYYTKQEEETINYYKNLSSLEKETQINETPVENE